MSTTTAKDKLVYYEPIYARLMIILGILFTLIFILGFFITDMWESIFYCAFTALMIIAGVNMLKIPYTIYDENNIILNSFTGKERERYSFKSKSAVRVKGSHLYLNNKKLKMNDWFIRKSDWKRMLDFYSDPSDTLMSELKDSSSL